jgi:phospholipid N-methyltransferase
MGGGVITVQIDFLEESYLERIAGTAKPEGWQQHLAAAQGAPRPTAKPSTAKAKPANNDALADKLAALAEAMTGTVEGKLADRETNTPKRMGQAMSARAEGERLARVQEALRRLAALHRAGECPPSLSKLKTKKAIYELVGEEMRQVPNGFHTYYVGTGEPRQGSSPEALELWAMLTGKSDEELKADKIAELMRGLQFSSIRGYFPTPAPLAARMVELAEIEAHHVVLEPSAGSGAILDAIEAAQPEALAVCWEINPTLCNVLQAKGYDARPVDCLSHNGSAIYDRVLMNPPFENQQDIDHVMGAFTRLKPGGRLVSIMSPSPFFRSGKKAEEFRAWFEELGGTAEDLPSGTFKEAGTGVESKLITIEKE